MVHRRATSSPGCPRGAARALLPVHLAIMAAYAARQLWLLARGRPVSPGKNVVVATTWVAWFVGIVLLDSDYAFTVTNVLVHGIPYLALVWLYGRSRYAAASGLVARAFRPGAGGRCTSRRWSALAWLEEWGWDRLLWHERPGAVPGRRPQPGPGGAGAARAPARAAPGHALRPRRLDLADARESPTCARRLGF